MIINFNGEYKLQDRLLQLKFSNQFSQDKECIVSMDNVQGAHGFSRHCPVCLDIVQVICGQCPHFPGIPWTLSRESMDIVQGDSGQCPLDPSTLSSLIGLPGLCPEYPWTLSRLSTDSMDNVQGVHRHYPGSPWIQWTFYRRVYITTLFKGNIM